MTRRLQLGQDHAISADDWPLTDMPDCVDMAEMNLLLWSSG